MAARRLAVAIPPTAPPPPLRPPTAPPSRRISVRRSSPSLASMLSSDFLRRPRYRCCCRLFHLKTASFLIGLADTLAMSSAFGRGVHLGLSTQHNPMAIAWFVLSSLMFIFGCSCTLAMFYGIWRENYLWIIPKLVMKIFAILTYSAATVILVYMIMEHNEYVLDLVAQHVTKSDYEAARHAVRTGGGGLVIAFLLMALMHVWFTLVIYRCYQYVKDRYFWRKSRMLMSASNDNHVNAITASILSNSNHPHIDLSHASYNNMAASSSVNGDAFFNIPDDYVNRNNEIIDPQPSIEFDPIPFQSFETNVPSNKIRPRHEIFDNYDQTLLNSHNDSNRDFLRSNFGQSHV